MAEGSRIPKTKAWADPDGIGVATGLVPYLLELGLGEAHLAKVDSLVTRPV